jgi:hypothetical protein
MENKLGIMNIIVSRRQYWDDYSHMFLSLGVKQTEREDEHLLSPSDEVKSG